MKTLVKTAFILIVFSMFAFIGCTNKPSTPSPTERLANLQQQVDNDIVAYQNFEANDFENLRTSFIRIDSELGSIAPQEVQSYYEKLNLAQAYLQQFLEVKTSLKNKLDYSKKQLTDLQYDLENAMINDSLFSVYFERETIAADTLHNQILYFKDRFGSCQKELDALK
ncbi:MAG: hypothetical protein MJZ94_09105 [Bacteroidales bacterium]|nr:hypothetical protein [Bacteroidales bacterium]